VRLDKRWKFWFNVFNVAIFDYGAVHVGDKLSEHLIGLRGFPRHVVLYAHFAFAGNNVHRDGAFLAETIAPAHGLVILLVAMRRESDNVVAVLPVLAKPENLTLAYDFSVSAQMPANTVRLA
jgi:hypothetical protein